MTPALSQAITVNAPTLGSIAAIAVAMLGLIYSAFNSGAEVACFSLTPEEIDDVPDEAKRNRITTLLAKPDKLLATILIANNLVNVLIVIMLNFALGQIFVFNHPVVGFLAETVLLTFLILLFAEVTPKLYATSHNVTYVSAAAPILQTTMRVLSPVSRVMMKSSLLVRKAVDEKVDNLSMEDLTRALEASEVKSGDEKDILKGILTFGNKTVSEIMRPRVDVVDIEYDATWSQVVTTVVKHGYSRMPVYQDNPDNIKGMLYAKDLLPHMGKRDDSFAWQSLLRPVHFVPETRMIDDLLEDFRKKKMHMAVVVDEFGCTQGIATLEDVLEEIVGDIDDEYDTEEKFYTQIAPDTFVFDAKTPLNDFFEVTGTDETEFGDSAHGAETVAGLLLGLRGDFLKEKETLEHGRCKFLVLKVQKHRIARVRVHVQPQDNK